VQKLTKSVLGHGLWLLLMGFFFFQMAQMNELLRRGIIVVSDFNVGSKKWMK